MRLIRQLQQQVRNFFGISSIEANAFLILLPLMTLLLVLFPFYHHVFPLAETDFSSDRKQLEAHITKLNNARKNLNDEYQVEESMLSVVNPNTATFSDLVLVGFDTITAATLIKFRNSGAEFTYKEDIKRIYTVDDAVYDILKDKIDLPDKPELKIVKTEPEKNKEKEIKEPAVAEANILLFDINNTDSLTLLGLRGIGPVLSSRIIRYRDILGGFTDTTQYKEVYGVKGGALEQLFMSAVIEKDFVPVKININTSEAAHLAQHPYISWTIANAIIAYRKQHGSYTSLDQLRNIKIIDEPGFQKILPYLSL